MKKITYADQTVHWEDWWHGYYYGAFYIFPPEAVMKEVDALRAQYDPKSAGFCRAHISLSEPLQRKITLADVDALRSDLGSIPPFEISYGPLRTHPPYPGVTYTIRPEEEFDTLRKVIHGNQLFQGVELKRSKIVPHMTIAEFITMEQTHKLFEKLKGEVTSGTFWCKEIVLAVPDNEMYFHPVLSIPLGTGS
ncbi:MAG: 2'-5' RNA ligase family protein [Bacteroidetes bacterium]|nr:MAG: 2'-5' RNA ligase family protein [Bacteroidota bacterium]